jgi:hypothetical protein
MPTLPKIAENEKQSWEAVQFGFFGNFGDFGNPAVLTPLVPLHSWYFFIN